MRVRLITTGSLERKSMAAGLSRLFGGMHTFSAADRCDGFTSVRLPARAIVENGGSTLRRIVAAIAGAITPGRRHEPGYDYVIAMDDLELCNKDQPFVVLDQLGRAIDQHLEEYEAVRGGMSADRLRARLRERASFHLIVPMIESWFFADPPSLQRAGVPIGSRIQLLSTDCEDFLTDHDEYLAGGGAGVEQHPKQYLDYLCRAAGPFGYHETSGGSAALEQLDFANAVVCGMPFMRRLLEDLHDALSDRSPAWIAASSGPCSLSGAKTARLRNL